MVSVEPPPCSPLNMEGWGSQGAEFLQSRDADRLGGGETALSLGMPKEGCSWATFSQSQHLFGLQNQPSPSQGRNPWKYAFTRAFVTADSILFLPHLNLWTKNQLQILKHPKGEASHLSLHVLPLPKPSLYQAELCFWLFHRGNLIPYSTWGDWTGFFTPFLLQVSIPLIY